MDNLVFTEQFEYLKNVEFVGERHQVADLLVSEESESSETKDISKMNENISNCKY